MAFEYKPDRWSSRAPLDPKQCKASVSTPGVWGQKHKCTRKHWKDGWCKQHHPDTKKSRDEASKKQRDDKWHNSETMRLSRCMEFVKAFDDWTQFRTKLSVEENEERYTKMMKARKEI